MSSELLVGIDVGTSSVKVAVTGPDGTEISHAGRRLRWAATPTGAQTTAEHIRELAMAAVGEALAKAPRGEVAGVGVTGMAEAGTLLDRHGSALSPVLAWHDTKGTEEARRLGVDLGTDRFTATTGLRLSATPTIVKLRWLKDHTGAAASADRWLGAPEGLAHSLGGAPVSDLSLACRTGLLDLSARTWWWEAIDWLGVPARLLAEPTPSGSPLGRVRPAADVPPRLHGAMVTVAGHDHLTAAVGAGVTADADVFASCGTAEALVRSSQPLSRTQLDQAVAGGLSVSWHVLPDRQAVIATAPLGLFLSSVLELLGKSAPDALSTLDAEALAATDVPGLRFDGAGSGSAALMGVRPGCRPENVWRAAVTASADRSAAFLSTLDAACGPHDRVVATGGWTGSRMFLCALTDRLGQVVLPIVSQAAARGAALMAGVAAGLYRCVADMPAPTYKIVDGPPGSVDNDAAEASTEGALQ